MLNGSGLEIKNQNKIQKQKQKTLDIIERMFYITYAANRCSSIVRPGPAKGFELLQVFGNCLFFYQAAVDEVYRI